MSEYFGGPRGRRQLLVGIFRNAALGLLGAGGAAALLKRRRLVHQGKCLNSGICRGCEIFDACSLPQALSARTALERGPNG